VKWFEWSKSEFVLFPLYSLIRYAPQRKEVILFIDAIYFMVSHTFIINHFFAN